MILESHHIKVYNLYIQIICIMLIGKQTFIVATLLYKSPPHLIHLIRHNNKGQHATCVKILILYTVNIKAIDRFINMQPLTIALNKFGSISITLGFIEKMIIF